MGQLSSRITEALIGFLTASRRAERSPDSEAGTAQFDTWRLPRARGAGFLAGSVAGGFGLGFALGWPLTGTGLGMLLGAGLVALTMSRAPANVREQPGKYNSLMRAKE